VELLVLGEVELGLSNVSARSFLFSRSCEVWLWSPTIARLAKLMFGAGLTGAGTRMFCRFDRVYISQVVEMGHWVCKFPKEMLAALLRRVSRENADQAPTRLMCNESCQPSHSGARLS